MTEAILIGIVILIACIVLPWLASVVIWTFAMVALFIGCAIAVLVECFEGDR